MRVAIAYFSIIILWATTPLAIKWSGQGPGFIFGAASRMTIGAFFMLLLLVIRRKRLPAHKKAKQTYLTIAIQIYAAMMSVYWGAQYVPSGWISVIFGLSPFITAIFAALWLNEHQFSIAKLISYILGVAGLALIFNSALQLNTQAAYGIVSILMAVLIQTGSAVWVKRIQANLSAVEQVTGGLLYTLPVYLLTWLVLNDGQWPAHLEMINIASILYLGLVATTIGFVLYYYLLIHLKTTTVALIPMISPVLALYIGHTINNEPLTLNIVSGTALILLALLMHEFFDRLRRKK
jgi:drug/metabolite transporter (DMT)-like permease